MVLPPELRCCSPGLDALARGLEKREIRTYAGILEVNSLAKRRFVDVHMDLSQAVTGDVDIRCLSRLSHATKTR
jgi:hypothetical protein